MKKTIFFLFAISSLSNSYIGCYDVGCTKFDIEKNKHGTILTSTGVEYKIESNSEFKKVEGGQKFKKIKLYLGKSCDAYSKKYGKGEWSWFGKDFFVEFNTETFYFSKQELDIETDNKSSCKRSSYPYSYIGCYDKGCTEFKSEKNSHGMVFKSTGVQYEYRGVGVSSFAEPIYEEKRLKQEILYLGRSCDAYSKKHGKGKWSWANGGFIIEFKNGIKFGFPRQELFDIETDEELGCKM